MRERRWTDADGPFDVVPAVVAGVAALVVCIGCYARWSLVVPADDGAGPYRSPGRVHGLIVLAVVVAIVAVPLLLRAWISLALGAAFTAMALVAIAAMMIYGAYQPRAEAQIVADGFGDSFYTADVRRPFTVYNTTSVPVTVCLGLSGDCDSGAAGPERLRAPGVSVPGGHRITVYAPEKAGDFKITLVGPGISRRDAVLHTTEPPPAS
ncbi:hypothetical protein [Dactylosporangium sp. NPDC051541]|uniref:hypothetical protein n=1 Tax=Dactylosporangium sp. NPDC051541 TaxID=3363977 RepID=UPI00379CA138